jgi:hypothetical protein
VGSSTLHRVNAWAAPAAFRTATLSRSSTTLPPPATAAFGFAPQLRRLPFKGSKSLSGPNGNLDSLTGFFSLLPCNGLDNVSCLRRATGTPLCYETLCPSSSYYATSGTVSSKTKLTQVSSMDQLEDSATCPNGTCFFYDQSSGLLFINMVQEQPNAAGPYTSPLGRCSGTVSTGVLHARAKTSTPVRNANYIQSRLIRAAIRPTALRPARHTGQWAAKLTSQGLRP